MFQKLNFFKNLSKLPVPLIDQIRFSPFLAQIVPIRKCNLECGYCNEFDKTSEPVDTEILKKRIKKIWELGTLAIEFSGGEPLLHPDIIELIRYSTSLNFAARMVITNGFLLNEDIIRALNSAGLTDIQISIDGVVPNKMTVKTLRSLKEKLRLAAALGQFNVVINSVVGAAPPCEVLEVVNFAKELGFVPRILVLHGEDGQIKLKQEDLKLYYDLKRKVKKRLLHGSSATDKMINGEDAFFKCRGGGRYLYIDEFGDVSWCSQKRELWKKPLDDYSIADLKEQFYKQKGCENLCSIGCVRTCSSIDSFRKYDE